VKISCCLVVIVLIGGILSIRPSFAQDVRSGAHEDVGASDDAGAPAAENRIKLDSQLTPHGDNNSVNGAQPPAEINHAAKDGSGGGANERAPDAIDTSISVQPHRSGGKPNKIGETKPNVPPTLKNSHRRTFSTLGSANRIGRNSIGVPIGQREDIERRDNKQFASPVGPRIPASTTTRPPTGSVIKMEAQIAHPVPNMVRPSRSQAANHAAINGTGLVHRAPNSSGIGGPSTAVVGINGTSIRPKY
jgi:hypothetical protein